MDRCVCVGLSQTTRMLLPFTIILLSSLVAVESAIAFGTCPRSEFGKETTEETWECDNGRSTCSSSTDSCSSEGSQTSTSGTSYYAADGSFESAVGGGWDCRQIHRYHLLSRFFYQFKYDKLSYFLLALSILSIKKKLDFEPTRAGAP